MRRAVYPDGLWSTACRKAKRDLGIDGYVELTRRALDALGLRA